MFKIACSYADSRTVEFIFGICTSGLNDQEKDIFVNQTSGKRENLFTYAASNVDSDVIKYIAKLNPDLNDGEDNHLSNALLQCAYAGHDETMRYLIEDLKLDVTTTDRPNYRNLFHLAVMNKGHGTQIAMFINTTDGKLKFQKDKSGDTALTLCAFGGDEKAMARCQIYVRKV